LGLPLFLVMRQRKLEETALNNQQ